jgi:hypothetical protein
MLGLCAYAVRVNDQQEPEELIIDEAPPAAELEREARMTPAQAVAQMRIRVPARGNKKLRAVLDRVNQDTELKALWHVSNVNAIARLQINDHSWVHIQIVANISLKLLRQLTKHGVEPSLVADYGFTAEDSEIAVLVGALLTTQGCPFTATTTRTSASSSRRARGASCSSRRTRSPS